MATSTSCAPASRCRPTETRCKHRSGSRRPSPDTGTHVRGQFPKDHRPTDGERQAWRPARIRAQDPGCACTRSCIDFALSDNPGHEICMNTFDRQSALAATLADPRWAALQARDGRADGTFFYSVRTTEITMDLKKKNKLKPK